MRRITVGGPELAGFVSLGADDPAAPAATGSTDVRFDSAPTVFNRTQLRAFR